MTDYNALRALALATQNIDDHYISRSLATTNFSNAASPGTVLGLLDEINNLRSENARLSEEVELDDKIIAERDRLVAAIPQCPAHGACIPYAIEWVEKSILMMKELKAENDALRAQVQSMIDQTTPLIPVPGDPGWSRRVTIDELQAELDELRKDAERYRFISGRKHEENLHALIMYRNRKANTQCIVGGQQADSVIDGLIRDACL